MSLAEYPQSAEGIDVLATCDSVGNVGAACRAFTAEHAEGDEISNFGFASAVSAFSAVSLPTAPAQRHKCSAQADKHQVYFAINRIRPLMG